MKCTLKARSGPGAESNRSERDQKPEPWLCQWGGKEKDMGSRMTTGWEVSRHRGSILVSFLSTWHNPESFGKKDSKLRNASLRLGYRQVSDIFFS